MKTLLILRHAKSSWEDRALDDHERPLNERGRHDAPLIGRFLLERRLTPKLIVSSDAVRAHETAVAVGNAAHYGGDIEAEPGLYLADPDDILAVLRAIREPLAEIVMVVGHNPGLEMLLAQLTGEQETLPTAGLAQVVLPIEQWREVSGSTRGTLVAVWRPKELA